MTDTNKQQESRVYKTADIVLAAALIEKGMQVKDVEPIAEKKKHDIYRFVFEDTDERHSFILTFTSKGFLVEPISFMNNIRNLKQLIKEKKRLTDESA